MSNDEFPTDQPAVVTCGLPYANGDLHVGHLRTYVDGDALSRSLRRIGQQTAFVSGSDMHGTPVAVNAAEEGVEPREFALDFHETYAETFPQFNIEFDNYGHTDDETNVELTQEFVRSWVENDHVHEKEIEVAWDTEEDQPLPDRYVEGTCPYCGEQARGDECDEGCQRHLEPGEIEDPVSTLTGNPAEYRTREHKFLRLADFQEYLQGFLDRLEGTDNAQNQPREWIEGELQDLCITRDMDWGVDYPEDVDGGDELVLYVWVDAPIEYVASTKQYAERVGDDEYDWEQVWKVDGEEHHGTEWDDEWSDDNGEIIHVIGRDIIQHHAVFWPAMLRGAGYNEPRSILATGFVGIDGKALSTSRNRAVWADEYLDAGFHPDLFRYYIATGAQIDTDVDFSWDRFQERVNGELVGNVGNFIYRSLLFAERNYDGTPDAPVSDDVRDRIESAIEDFEAAVREYDVRELAEIAIELSNYGNEYIQRNEPWNLVDDDPERAEQVIRDCVQLTKAVAVLMQPVLPGKAERLWGQLGEQGSVADVTLDSALEAPPAEFGEPAELFEQVEDDHIEALNEELQERVEEASEASAEASNEGGEAAGDEVDDGDVDTADLQPLVEDRISFEDFEGVDMRVGEIRSAEPVEGADKLLRLEVDIGHEVRQVVAGLRQLHDAEALPGTRVILLANMEKAELFGIESNGMVLAAGDEADLLTTHEDAPLGTRIK
ncbi:methionyl-tRNA synthetase [Haloarcula hispanica N601]|uniref:Methionine--tRNA ligase n=3 Tax=Haloarcula hispanica TaxID=51589 RepID=V5TQ11_HALHI|nr:MULTISPECIES: methionine--tRNA ligase [Haloarcula]AEM57915.1 methionyl-tRNA synthetase [Haloarcula hispanica ATCC 33960]AHB66664.1 methionyl-tRNA synthetase [Haloarcula hispanica N601]KZX47549.1 methionine--tRNA ligase [Haloarcula sp. K1]MCJ0619646.1 methionine--tRNA ligase [Haloarcula hispanica]MUV50824.1 methionine--tRNA ligase [Haloarcula sp. CBA1122]